MCNAAKRFLMALKESDLDRDGEISIEEFKKAFVEVCVVISYTYI
jgi:Ca2+-binding EF-hand superfamily protein